MIDLECGYDDAWALTMLPSWPSVLQKIIYRDAVADNWLARWRQRIGERHYERTSRALKWPMWGRWRLIQFEGEITGVELDGNMTITLTARNLTKTIDVVLPRYMGAQEAVEWYESHQR